MSPKDVAPFNPPAPFPACSSAPAALARRRCRGRAARTRIALEAGGPSFGKKRQERFRFEGMRQRNVCPEFTDAEAGPVRQDITSVFRPGWVFEQVETEIDVVLA